MHAIRQLGFGPAETLRYERVDDPVPGPGQVRVAVRAAGVHLLDASVRAGYPGVPFPLPSLPMVPGQEGAGVVDSVGPGVDPAWLGEAVVTHLGLASGGYAELIVREASALHVIPPGMTPECAVAMVGTGRTALGVLDVALPSEADVVLVTAAAGGVGNLLVQAAHQAGATVVAAAGGRAKLARLCGLGADVTVDYSAPGWPETAREALNGREVTVVVDGVGSALGRDALGLLGFGGRFIQYGWSAGAPTEIGTEDLRGRALTATLAVGPSLLRRPGGLRALEEAAIAEAARDRLRPLVQSFPLAEAAKAHLALENRETVGKVVLVP